MSCSSANKDIGTKKNVKWGPDNIETFLETFQNYELLWNIRHEDYSNKRKRESSILKLKEDLESQDVVVPDVAFLRARIKAIKTTYRSDLLIVTSSKRSGAGADDVYTPKLPWFKTADKFLNSVVVTRYSQSNLCDELPVKSNYRNAKGVYVLRRKKNYEVASILDDRICDLKKKLDVLRHQSRVAQTRMKKLASEYQELLQKVFTTQKKDVGDHLTAKQVCSLENQIHRVEMNMMEAEHVKKKYRSIRTSLLDDSVEFESTLKRLESMIQKQQAEINHLQEINKEAMDLRDMTKGTLVKQETVALNAGKLRERQLQEFRVQVEERRLELERLERRIFPTSRPLVHQDSTSSTDGQATADETATAAATDFLESAFAKLKEATGESETEEVLHRFLSQRETMSRLTYLKNITEEEKRDLEVKKDFMMAELEAFKFAEVKDKEQNMEEVENLKQLIEKQNKRKEKLDEQIKRITQQLLEINEILFGFCLKLQDVDDVPLPAQTSDFSTVREVLHILEHKIQSAVQILCEREEARKAMEEGSSQAYSSGRLLAEDSWKFQQNQQKSNQESRPSILAASETDEEDDVPTRSYLKRQAQIIVDAKSRRKQFNFNRGRK